MQVVQVDEYVKQKLTSLNLAIDGWEAADALLEELNRQKLPPGSRLFDGLVAGACVLYGRPFKHAPGRVRLTELSRFDGLSDATILSEIHEAACDGRDVVLADQEISTSIGGAMDANGQDSADETIVTLKPEGPDVEFASLRPPEDLSESLPLLLKKQMARARSMRVQLMAAVLPPPYSEEDQFKIVAE